MSSLIDGSYFQELADSDPEGVCRRAQCRYDGELKSYTLPVWGEDFIVYPLSHKMERLGTHSDKIDDLMGLFIIYYLLKCKDLDVDNDWISEKDMPGGPTFFRGPHAVPTGLIAHKYNGFVQEFNQRCQRLNGIPLEMADGAYSFWITSRIPVAVLFWDGDEDFSAEAKILFDRTITEHLTLDIIFSLAVVICQRVAGINSG